MFRIKSSNKPIAKHNVKTIAKEIDNIRALPTGYLKFSQMPTVDSNDKQIILTQGDLLPILRANGESGYINYLALFNMTAGIQTISSPDQSITVNNTNPNNPTIEVSESIQATIINNTKAIATLQGQVATLIAQLNGTGSAIQVSAIGIGTPAGVAGSVTAKGDVIAFYGVSDD